MFALIGNISSNFDNQELLKTGDTLQHDKHAKIMRLMNDTIELLQISMATNSIAHCGQAQQSCNYFQRSSEGISPQQKLPYSRQRNNDSQYQNAQQEKAVNTRNNLVIADKIMIDDASVDGNTDCHC